MMQSVDFSSGPHILAAAVSFFRYNQFSRARYSSQAILALSSSSSRP